ncbi:MAG: response regulator [Smithellaceae bacterium]|nr:response regulator [Smithellaceae bacterium]
MRILVVDDCQTTRKILGLYLRSKGFEVISAENGLEAIEKLATQEVNLIMSDLNMPYMDGIELVKTLKNDPNWSHIPILIVTTEADPVEREKAFTAGASGYLVKPVTAEAISFNIKEIIKDIFKKRGSHD